MGSTSILFLLVFLLLISESSQGIRLDEALKLSLEKKSHVHESFLSRASMDTASEIILCNHGHCAAGKHRNLASVTTSSTLVIPKKDRNEGITSKTTSEAAKAGEENVKGEGSPKPPHMDVAGIIEMDYSPARRKTPIHN